MNLLHLLFGLQGRIGRGQFWLSVLICIVFLVVVIGLTTIATGSLTAVFGAAMLACIPLLISAIFVGIKRLHDRNKSALWLLVFYGIPIVALILVPILLVGDADTDTIPASITVLQYVGLAVLLRALVELGFIRGTIGGNPYGPDPVAPKPAKH
jgi:uncharacterized membrane protein YhaH (DUF805 family)